LKDCHAGGKTPVGAERWKAQRLAEDARVTIGGVKHLTEDVEDVTGWRMAAEDFTRVADCAHCGESFTPQRSTARFCSDTCRVYASRKPRKKK
jgi:hypothetical protein